MAAKESLALFLIGAPGAGKSETLTRAHDDLDASGIQSAAIDTDELARSYPPIGLERQIDHVRYLARSYVESGQTLLLVAATVESDAELERWLPALEVDRQVVVHLVASAPTLERRVREREPEGWAGLPELVEAARRLGGLRFARTDHELDTEMHNRDEIAQSVAEILNCPI